MPTISKFYGISISIRVREGNHNRPHFHARYGEFEVSIAMNNFEILGGRLPRRALELTLIWAALHQAELFSAWQALRDERVPAKIAPLA